MRKLFRGFFFVVRRRCLVAFLREGERAGHLNPEFDKQFMDSLLQENPDWLSQFSSEDIIEKVGTAGLEIIMWVAARNTLQGPVREIHRNYHIPISNTAAGTQAIAPFNLK